MKKIVGMMAGLCLCTLPISAQGILELSTDARSTGMGGVATAVSAGNGVAFHNASLAAFRTDKAAVSYSYSPTLSHLQDGYNLHTVSGFAKLGKKYGQTAGFRYYGLPEGERTDPNGAVIGTIKPREWAAELGYFYEVLHNLSLSINLRYVSSDLDIEGMNAADAFCFDFGASYRQAISAWMDGKASWTVGFNLKNIGGKLDYGEGGKVSLPGSASVGGALQLPFNENNALECGVDIDYLLPSELEGLQAGIGAEYTFLKHGMLRAGYHLGNEDKGYSNYGSVGCGVRFFQVQGDFAYVLAGNDSPMKNLWQVSLGIAF